MRTICTAVITCLACLVLLASPAAAARSFPETGFSITNDKMLDYFDHRGGARVFGPPISREFDFMGTKVQFFQRAVLQLQPGGSVGLINLLSKDLLPYTRINGSSFPSEDAAMLAAAPSGNDVEYAAKAIEFARDSAPDVWQGMKTNFFSTMMNTVGYKDAFPNGEGDQSLMPLINLEIWGLPTSKPTVDPMNGNFVYLRFQRGIMHFDQTSGATQGVLLGDYLKSVITGGNLPADLAQDARASGLYRQYDNSVLLGLARSADLPGTNMFAAFEKDGVVLPVPVVAVPTPTAIPAAVPAAVPASPAAPASLVVVGNSTYVRQINMALSTLEQKSPFTYAIVKQNVARIEQSRTPSTDLPARTLRIDDATAWSPEWSSNEYGQREWLASLIVHNAVHIAQYGRGEATKGPDAEKEALSRQQDALAGIETSVPPAQLWRFLQAALDNNTGWFTDWNQPRAPETVPQ